MKNFTLRPEPILSDVEGRLSGEISEIFLHQRVIHVLDRCRPPCLLMLYDASA